MLRRMLHAEEMKTREEKKNGRVEKDEDGKEIKYEQKGTGVREEIERVERETKRKRGVEKTNTRRMRGSGRRRNRKQNEHEESGRDEE